MMASKAPFLKFFQYSCLSQQLHHHSKLPRPVSCLITSQQCKFADMDKLGQMPITSLSSSASTVQKSSGSAYTFESNTIALAVWSSLTTILPPRGPTMPTAVTSGSHHTLSTRVSAAAAPSALFLNTTTESDTLPTAAPCGKGSSKFTIDFDDLPSFSTGSDDTDIPPIFNPYRKLYWEGQFGYVPRKSF